MSGVVLNDSDMESGIACSVALKNILIREILVGAHPLLKHPDFSRHWRLETYFKPAGFKAAVSNLHDQPVLYNRTRQSTHWKLIKCMLYGFGL